MDFLKRLGELTWSPTELRFREVQTILYHFGYELVNSRGQHHFGTKSGAGRGSHFRFKKKGFPGITIVVHNKKVKKWYVKAMAKILLSQLPLQKL